MNSRYSSVDSYVSQDTRLLYDRKISCANFDFSFSIWTSYGFEDERKAHIGGLVRSRWQVGFGATSVKRFEREQLARYLTTGSTDCLHQIAGP